MQQLCKPAATGRWMEAAAQAERKGEAREQDACGGTDDQIVALPVAFAKITCAKQIVDHAAPKHDQGEKHALLQEEWLIESERSAEQHEHNRGPRNDDPFDRKLKIEQRNDGGGAEISQ